jgi:hypothetical protein
VAKEPEKKKAKSESGSTGPEEAAPSAKAEEPKEEKKESGES